MKRFLLATALAAGVGAPAHAASVPIEADAIISDTSDFPRSRLVTLIDPGVGMIRAMGWRCDSVSALRPHMFSRGFTLTCNRYNYVYEFKDRGGNWVVDLK